ncbi:MAG: 5,6-dimethylbenzimidazole synthase [Acidobacteria bacterium]|nr:5,6-dimethylbenzimidazole synthase [Acidobacteriota bacterium]
MVTKLCNPGGDSRLFSDAERQGVYRAVYERRDIRAQFLPTPVPDEILGRILSAAHHAPSVGFMQPWDFIVISDRSVRRAVLENFSQANREAAERYQGERREMYFRLKLEGILDAPFNLCVTCDRTRTLGSGLGRQSVPETDLYSTVCAIQNLWLAARAESIGVGWVSILDHGQLRSLLGIPAHVTPVAYLCIGYVQQFPASPELEAKGWCQREPLSRLIHFEHWDARDEARASRLIQGGEVQA